MSDQTQIHFISKLFIMYLRTYPCLRFKKVQRKWIFCLDIKFQICLDTIFWVFGFSIYYDKNVMSLIEGVFWAVWFFITFWNISYVIGSSFYSWAYVFVNWLSSSMNKSILDKVDLADDICNSHLKKLVMFRGLSNDAYIHFYSNWPLTNDDNGQHLFFLIY